MLDEGYNNMVETLELPRFEYAAKYVLQNEGGYVNNPSDPGGETNFGISEDSFPDISIAELTPAKAKDIYKKTFWDKCNLRLINSSCIAAKLLDMCVWCGANTGIKIAQRALYACDWRVKWDGCLGQKTAHAINSVDESTYLTALKAELAGHLRLLCKENPKLNIFFNGWMKRAYSHPE